MVDFLRAFSCFAIEIALPYEYYTKKQGESQDIRLCSMICRWRGLDAAQAPLPAVAAEPKEKENRRGWRQLGICAASGANTAGSIDTTNIKRARRHEGGTYNMAGVDAAQSAATRCCRRTERKRKTQRMAATWYLRRKRRKYGGSTTDNGSNKSAPPRGGTRSCWCRWRGSNPHGLLAQRILSPPRLPIPTHRLARLL